MCVSKYYFISLMLFTQFACHYLCTAAIFSLSLSFSFIASHWSFNLEVSRLPLIFKRNSLYREKTHFAENINYGDYSKHSQL